MSDNIFQQTPAEPTDPQPTKPAIPQEVAELVGDGKKYASVEDALKSVPHAQTHINKLEQELATMREELQARKTAEQLLDEIKSGMTTTSEKTSPQPVDPDTIAKTVSQVIEQREAQKTAQQNITSVVGAFTEAFGKEQAEQAFIRVAQDSGLSVQSLNKLAATSPSAVLKLAGIGTKKEVPVGKVQSSVNTEALNPGAGQDVSAKVPRGASTKDMVQAWRNAGIKVKQNQQV